MSEFAADVTVVGGGIAGLWSAKELIDQGLTVNVVEKSDTLADGATTRNEGWLHAGTYHSVAIENEDEIVPVTTNTRRSHEAIVSFAPESIDHAPTFAVTLSDELAHKAVSRWEQTGVGFQEVSKREIPDASRIDTERLSAAFRVDDKSVNSRVLCQKLAHYVFEHGGKFFLGADFVPSGDNTAEVVQGDDRHTLASSRFLITAGTGIKEIVESVTGQELPMRFFKAHLLVLPRLTTDNYFHLEAGEAGLMNHDNTSVVGINRDGIELTTPDRTVVQEKKKLIYDALARLLPSVVQYPINSASVMAVACSKPDVTGGFGETQSLDVNVFEPAPNYVCALPGKMTMAPYLAKKVAGILLSDNSELIQRRAFGHPGDITMRPADRWMSEQAS
jgi:glycine/D-amino acid oxidase-like deaminating enzyme